LTDGLGPAYTPYALLGIGVIALSIRQSLLAILAEGPMHGYGLKLEFEAATGDVWPLNPGQVYTTLGRLERDGLVVFEPDAEGQKVYELTDAGRDELLRWFDTPVPREEMPRQELAIKLVFAVRSGAADVGSVVQRQRAATMRSLQELTRLRATADGDDLAWVLMVEGLMFQAEGELRWLDLCEARLVMDGTAQRRRAPEAHPRAAERRA
jgi:DNA-binding PadR family transcriptional regulator